MRIVLDLNTVLMCVSTYVQNKKNIKILLLTAANTVKGMEGQEKSDILYHPKQVTCYIYNL